MKATVEQTAQPDQRRLVGLRLHPEAAEVPPITESEFETLREDIDTRGVLAPIEITEEGVVLDGRARLRAARELGHETIAVTVVGTPDEVEHILRAALH